MSPIDRGFLHMTSYSTLIKLCICLVLFSSYSKFVENHRFLPRDSYAKHGICCRRVSVCVSVTLRYCIKTAKRRITQTTPHDSPMTLVFLCQRSRRNSNGITPYGGDKCRWGGLKFVTFDEKHAITRKQYKIDV